MALTDYAGGFWLQQTGHDSERTIHAISYKKDSVLHFLADFTLNKENHAIQGEMPAHRRIAFFPIFLYYMVP